MRDRVDRRPSIGCVRCETGVVPSHVIMCGKQTDILCILNCLLVGSLN